MKTLKNLFAGTAIVGLMAAPAFALTLDAGAGLSVDSSAAISAGSGNTGSSVKVAAGADASAKTKIGTGGTASAAEETAVAGTAAAMADTEFMVASDSAFMGNVVTSSDGAMVGTVHQVMVDASGKTKILVDVDSSLDTDATRFALEVGADADADGEIKLGWTMAELLASLNAQVQASAANG